MILSCQKFIQINLIWPRTGAELNRNQLIKRRRRFTTISKRRRFKTTSKWIPPKRQNCYKTKYSHFKIFNFNFNLPSEWVFRFSWFSQMEIGSGPIASCSKEHQKIYQEWFNFADSGTFSFSPCLNHYQSHLVESNHESHLLIFFPLDGDGRITGNDATKFFAMSKLSRSELKQVTNFSLFNFFFGSNLSISRFGDLIWFEF